MSGSNNCVPIFVIEGPMKDISIRKYTNGWRVYDIDSHPHGKVYRDPHNKLGFECYPFEHLMLVNSSGCVVLFLRNISDLNRTEKDMGLIRKA